MFAAARRASGTAMTMPTIVPNKAISTVCSVGQTAAGSLEKSGGMARHINVRHAVDSGDEILRPRLDDNERLNDDGEPEQHQHAMERGGQRRPHAPEPEALFAPRACNVDTHAASWT